MQPKLFVATKAFVTHGGKVLILKESSRYEDGTNANKFDVTGGRVEPGERFDDSLRREVKEETGLSVTIGKPFFVNEWRPVVKDEQWQIVGIFFECAAKTDKITLGEDHDEFRWIDPKDYKNHNLIENLRLAFETYINQTLAIRQSLTGGISVMQSGIISGVRLYANTTIFYSTNRLKTGGIRCISRQ